MNVFTKLWHRLEWKQQHYQPPIEKSDEEHVCAYCNEHYSGNYCPQCGLQYGRERFTWKTVALNMMDLWGIGNRNVFLTIWHLLWRPGYLMYDYLRSKHRAYFPPIPLLVAICLLFTLMVNTLHITWDTDMDQVYDIHVNFEKGKSTAVGNDKNKEEDNAQFTKNDELINKQALSLEQLLKAERQWSRENIAYSLIISNLLIIFLASWIFHQSPRIQLTIVESFYVQMYIACQMMIVAIPYTLITWKICEASVLPYPLPSLLAFVILVVDYHQLCGYSIWGTIWRLLVMIFSYTLFGVVISMLLTIGYLFFPIITG
ncbi:MAG: DUF3667 domain-containing protein [Bacteroidaceae bacterium]|nr:DUF3667 domain-containing protein [Bacteroidaceae bacterium]